MGVKERRERQTGLLRQDRDDLVFCVCEELLAGLVRELREVEERHRDPLVALKNGLRHRFSS